MGRWLIGEGLREALVYILDRQTAAVREANAHLGEGEVAQAEPSRPSGVDTPYVDLGGKGREDPDRCFGNDRAGTYKQAVDRAALKQTWWNKCITGSFPKQVSALKTKLNQQVNFMDTAREMIANLTLRYLSSETIPGYDREYQLVGSAIKYANRRERLEEEWALTLQVGGRGKLTVFPRLGSVSRHRSPPVARASVAAGDSHAAGAPGQV